MRRWSLVLLVLTLLLAADATSASTTRVVFLTHTASRELRRSDPNDEGSSMGLDRRDAQLEGGRIGLRPSRPGKKPEYVAHPASDLVCRPFGECEPCPENEVSCYELPYPGAQLILTFSLINRSVCHLGIDGCCTVSRPRMPRAWMRMGRRTGGSRRARCPLGKAVARS